MRALIPPHAAYFAGLSVAELAARLRRRETSSVELVGEVLEAIRGARFDLNAWTCVDGDHALRQARAADERLAAGDDAGPLHGIPVAVKDNIDTLGLATTYGSAHYAGWMPAADAACIRNLRDAGAIVVGKTLTHEFAYGSTGDRSLQGAARNPWDIGRMTGGSSAGSAAAVAAGMVPLAVGTDTGGSIRIPAALCGVVGLKPSHGAVATQGVFPVSTTLDHVGAIAGSVEDAALLLRALRGDKSVAYRTGSPPDASSRRRPRAAWLGDGGFGPVDPAVMRQAADAATRWFGGVAGLSSDTGRGGLVDAAAVVAGHAAALHRCMLVIQQAEAYETHAERLAREPGKFDPEVRQRLEAAGGVSGWEYVRAQREAVGLRAAMDELFLHYDVLLMPAVPVPAPALDERGTRVGNIEVPTRELLLSLTKAWNLVGGPVISMPAGLVGGLPVGLQIIGRRGHDDMLLDDMIATMAA
ncbi:hypothetical protein CAL12_14645 [Bordetella genomosp. 8]|uniref:Amidase domain-containing protein n=1 Tax=Bordetella genomosp. 8 TaxID=1416806 RepID=A0A1W6YLI9_9BORD|nr:amidase [Bordetella genomosp. 8]ARP81932.1 hypothetical protein CAL12_14645 [Bordetella genomosp. 8]